MMTGIDITISIVSYNTRDLLRACLASLRARQEEGEATLDMMSQMVVVSCREVIRVGSGWSL